MKKSYIVVTLILLALIVIFVLVNSYRNTKNGVTGDRQDTSSLSDINTDGPFLINKEILADTDCAIDIDTALESISYSVSVDASACPYTYAPADLDSDGNDEFLVYISDPDWCGTGGCNMLIVDAYNHILGNVTAVQTPVYVGQKLVNDWHPLFIESGIQLDQETNTYFPTYKQYNFAEKSGSGEYTETVELDMGVEELVSVDKYEMLAR